MSRGGLLVCFLSASIALTGAAGAAYHGDGGEIQRAEKEPAARVNANGNPFSGNLSFDPASVTVAVRDIVAWTNTDDTVPHTATEVNGLWHLGGDYGLPGEQFQRGFAPGETVSRDFDAGTWDYYCRVHGAEAQSGVVKVPVTLRVGRELIVRWGSGRLPESQVFDVQRKATRFQRQPGNWRTVLKGVTKQRAQFGYGPADVTSLAFRARVRDASDPEAISGWSPPAALALD